MFFCRMLEDIEGRPIGDRNNATETANKLFQSLDRDGDGNITIEEFVEGYMKYGIK